MNWQAIMTRLYWSFTRFGQRFYLQENVQKKRCHFGPRYNIYQSKRNYSSNGSTHSFLCRPKTWAELASLLLISGGSAYVYSNRNKKLLAKSKLPTYTADDVLQHSTKETGIWVSYLSGVYDITDFIDKHPGGDKILMAAGGSVEPFWLMYGVHKKPEVVALLEQYRIGDLHESDRGAAVKDLLDPYANDPKRHPVLKPWSTKPYNAEPPLELLVDNYITPTEIFFVRNHMPVPEIDPTTYRLRISGIGIKETYLTLDEIKKFPKFTITASLQCAGNRRGEMIDIKSIKGLSWGSAAMSTATWSGARLVDVLRFAGLDPESHDLINHVHLEGLDTDVANVCYGSSVPSDKALDERGDCLIAYEMNGEEITRDHGYPIRFIAPGIVGARNVKWLGEIILSNDESDSHWQQNDYKSFNPNIDWDTVDFKSAPAIQELPVQSVICEPKPGITISTKNKSDVLKIKGYAWSGGGFTIVRVDVSVDNGLNWVTAQLSPDGADTPRRKGWAWRLWQVEIPVSDLPKNESVVICCKALDENHNTQPETVGPIWNLRGVLNNAWHRVTIQTE